MAVTPGRWTPAHVAQAVVEFMRLGLVRREDAVVNL